MASIPTYTREQLESLDKENLIAIDLALQDAIVRLQEQFARLEADSWASTRPAGEEQQE